jgi:DNA excision repair protein ERCC-3
LEEKVEEARAEKSMEPEAKKPRIEQTDISKPATEVPSTADEDMDKFYDKIMGDEEDENAEAIRKLEILTFEIKPDTIEAVQKRCIEMDYPLLAEYDFRNDSFNPNLGIDLKASTKLR